MWQVVGGADLGGILVREGESRDSPPAAERLSTGALIKEEVLKGDRLAFSKVSGRGPSHGWVTVRLREKELCVRVDSAEMVPVVCPAAAAEAYVGWPPCASGPTQTTAAALPVRAVIFDLFGTVLQMRKRCMPWQSLFSAVGDEAQKRGLGALDQARARLFVQAADGPAAEVARQAVEQQLPGFPRSKFHGLCRQLDFERKVSAEAASAVLYDDATEALVRQRELGLMLGLVSNLATPYACVLDDCGIRHHFDAIVLSFQEGVIKGQQGDTRIYERAAERLGVLAEECLFVGDTVKDDYEGPVAAGMRAVHLHRGKAFRGPGSTAGVPRPTIATLARLESHLAAVDGVTFGGAGSRCDSP
mmetsp:Transcript_112828/g.364244  ORF Transcript_112828/g.364244 Transcript_112828/m.364244 type:complete len:360 (-) Transcript_112828:121-1200(-)